MIQLGFNRGLKGMLWTGGEGINAKQKGTEGKEGCTGNSLGLDFDGR